MHPGVNTEVGVNKEGRQDTDRRNVCAFFLAPLVAKGRGVFADGRGQISPCEQALETPRQGGKISKHSPQKAQHPEGENLNLEMGNR